MTHKADAWIELAFPGLERGYAYCVWHAIRKRAMRCADPTSADLSVHPTTACDHPQNFQLLLGTMPSVNLTDLVIGDVVVPAAHMRAGSEEASEWVEVAFSARVVPQGHWNVLCAQLRKFAMHVSTECAVERFEAGIDDSEDPSMRLFTNERCGPVSFDERGVSWGRRQ